MASGSNASTAELLSPFLQARCKDSKLGATPPQHWNAHQAKQSKFDDASARATATPTKCKGALLKIAALY